MLKTIQCFKSRVLPVTYIPLFSACITNTSFKYNCQCCYYFSINNGLFRYNYNISKNTPVIHYSILVDDNGTKSNMPKRSRSKNKKNSSTQTTPQKKPKVTRQSKIFNKNYSSKLLQLENYDGQMNDEACSNNSDELCVVYDFKEEKKNRVYEVITLSGDSEIDDSDEIIFVGCFKSEPAKNVEEVFLSSDSEHETSDIGNLVTKFESGSVKTELQSNNVDDASFEVLEDDYEKETQELKTVPYYSRIVSEPEKRLLKHVNSEENDFTNELSCCDEVKTSSVEDIYSHIVENKNIINEETQISDHDNFVVDNVIQPKKLKDLCCRALTDFVEDNEKGEKLEDLNFIAACIADSVSEQKIIENQKSTIYRSEDKCTNDNTNVEHCSLWSEIPEGDDQNYRSLSSSCNIKEETDLSKISQSCKRVYLNIITSTEAPADSSDTRVAHENNDKQFQSGLLEVSNSTLLLNKKDTFVEGTVQPEQETSLSYSDGELEIIDVINHSVENISDEYHFISKTSSEFDDDSCDYEEITGKHKYKEWRDTKIKIEYRCEELTDFGKIMKKGDVRGKHKVFKVMSYNVLSQSLLYKHLHLYSKHDQDALDWKRRRRLIYNEITTEQPDILCLQEVEEEHISSFYDRLEVIGYSSVYKQRTGNHVDGCAIYFKPSVFELQEKSTVEFKQPGVRVLDRDNVGVVLKFRVTNNPDNYLVVATTHLLYNPRRQDVKLAQVQVLLAEIERFAYNSKTKSYYPVILTGDFNLTPGTGVYKLITEGHIKYEGMSYKTLTPCVDYTIMTKQLLPCRLGITDSCQHVEILDQRSKLGGRGRVKLFHSDKKSNKRYRNEKNDSHCENDGRFYNGELSHNLNFSSVYRHETLDGKKEATTYHTDWVTVDYIFYSQVRNNGNELIEGDLQLISKLKLPSQEECQDKIRHLPNFAFGSDHLSLVAKFALNLH